MKTRLSKTQKDKSHTEGVAGKAIQSTAINFVDNRPEAIQMKARQELVNNSEQSKRLNEYQQIATSHVAQQAHAVQKKENKTGLPHNLKTGIEQLSGHAMDDVHVHYGSDKPAQLQAHAYAQGTDIHLAPGQEKHLPHEAWHVVQQKQGRVKPTMQMKSKVDINDDTGLEKEADVMGGKALQFVTGKSDDTAQFNKHRVTIPSIIQRATQKQIQSKTAKLQQINLKRQSVTEPTTFLASFNTIYETLVQYDQLWHELSVDSDYDPLRTELTQQVAAFHILVSDLASAYHAETGEISPEYDAVRNLFKGMQIQPAVFRQEKVKQAIKDVGGTKDPSYIRTLIFANNKLITNIQPKRTNTRDESEKPQNYMSHMSADGKMKKQSRDGEMFIIDEVNKAIGRFVKERQAKIEKGEETYEFRIELIGPQGTCSDCQEALKELLAVFRNKSKYGFNNHLTFTLITRWKGPKAIQHRGRNNRVRTYGNASASVEEGANKLEISD